MSSSVFIKLPKDIRKFVDGKVDNVCFVKDFTIPRDESDQFDNESFGLYMHSLVKKAREDFDQEMEKKLEYLVANCGPDILNHIRIVMDPYMFSVRTDGLEDLDNFTCAITTRARLEYFIDAEVVDG